MSEKFPITSEQMYLRDTISNLWALHDISPANTEPEVFGDQLVGDCAVFIDMLTGNRISLTPIPEDESKFVGAQVKIFAMAQPISLEINGQQVEMRECHFIVSSELDVFVNDPSKDTNWHRFPTGELAFLIDVPQIKPKAQSEEDIRLQPPILEGELPLVTSPEVLFEYFQGRVDNDLLKIPAEAAYTLLSAAIDERDLEDSSKIGEDIVLEGCFEKLLGKHLIQHLFRIEAYEIEPNLYEGEVLDFDREFVIKYQTLNGEKFLLGYTPGTERVPDNIKFVIGEEFDMRLEREALVLFGEHEKRQTPLIPHTLTAELLKLALENSVRFS